MTPIEIAQLLAAAAVEAAAEKAKGFAVELTRDLLDEAQALLTELFRPSLVANAKAIGVTDERRKVPLSPKSPV